MAQVRKNIVSIGQVLFYFMLKYLKFFIYDYYKRQGQSTI